MQRQHSLRSQGWNTSPAEVNHKSSSKAKLLFYNNLQTLFQKNLAVCSHLITSCGGLVRRKLRNARLTKPSPKPRVRGISSYLWCWVRGISSQCDEPGSRGIPAMRVVVAWTLINTTLFLGKCLMYATALAGFQYVLKTSHRFYSLG